MSAAEIVNELPKLSHQERRTIVRRIFELEESATTLDWAAQAADAAFQELDRFEEEHGPTARG